MTAAGDALLQLAVAAGAGGAGCMLRVLARDALAGLGVHAWWSIAAVNATGAFAMGAMQGGMQPHGGSPESLPAMVLVGMLGGWTTYSAFSWDFVRLWTSGSRASALVLWTATIVGAPALAIAGAALTGGSAP